MSAIPPIATEIAALRQVTFRARRRIVGVNAMNFSVAKVAFIPEGALVAT